MVGRVAEGTHQVPYVHSATQDEASNSPKVGIKFRAGDGAQQESVPSVHKALASIAAHTPQIKFSKTEISSRAIVTLLSKFFKYL